MTNEEIQKVVARAEDEYEMLKDKVHEQHDEIERLNNNIKEAIRLLDTYFSMGINIQEPKEKIKRVLRKRS